MSDPLTARPNAPSRTASPAAPASTSLTTSFITWYPSCRRSDTLASALGGRSHLIHYFEFKQPRYAPLKYLLQTFSSWRRLWRDSPDVVLVASPPVIAVAAVWCYCAIFRRGFVIDAHTGVFDDPRWAWARPLGRRLSRAALATIVTSDHLAAEVNSWGARSLVIGAVPVEFPSVEPAALGPGGHVLVVNTFSQDEPLDAVLRAARLCPQVTFHVTGNLKHARTATAAVDDAPANVRFTGWVSDERYAALLRGVDAVMCLTTHDHTMQRGGYEAMAVGQPLITSDWRLLRDTFAEGTRHVDNSPQQIAAAVVEVLADRDALSAQMRVWAERQRQNFLRNLQRLKTLCGDEQ